MIVEISVEQYMTKEDIIKQISVALGAEKCATSERIATSLREFSADFIDNEAEIKGGVSGDTYGVLVATFQRAASALVEWESQCVK